MGGVISGIGGLLLGNQQRKDEKAAAAASNALSKEQLDWQKTLDRLGLTRDYESARNWESELSPELGWQDALGQSETILNPLYQDQMETTLENQANANKRRGFYGQAPGDLLMQERAAEVEKARLGAIGQMASQLQQASQARRDQQKQFGAGAFGQYGNVTQPFASGTTNTSQSSASPSTLASLVDKIKKLGIYRQV
jgi:hypothetical protein